MRSEGNENFQSNDKTPLGRISELEKQIDELRRHNGIPYTLRVNRLVNEHYFLRRLRESLKSAERYARFVSIVLIQPMKKAGTNGGNPHCIITACRHKRALRRTDLVGYFEPGHIMVLLDEAEIHQAVLALRRIQGEMVGVSPCLYSVASYPTDGSKAEVLLNLLRERLQVIREDPKKGSCLNLGGENVPLSN